MTFKEMEDWIDRRFKTNFGNLQYKPGKDDPMGLALVGNDAAAQDAGIADVSAGPPQEAAGVSLVAFGKGKAGAKLSETANAAHAGAMGTAPENAPQYCH